MSSIAFHSSAVTVRVSGRDRFLFSFFANRALLQSLALTDASPGAEEALRARAVIDLFKVRPPEYVQRPASPRDTVLNLTTYLSVESAAAFDLGGGRIIQAWTCGLNTLLANGSDPMILAARLHGQCEIHCYVEGPNRAWLAEIIDRGRSAGIYREPYGYDGWEAVAALLRSRDDEPVVTSYSVTESFPNAGVAIDAGLWSPTPDLDGDDWYDIAELERWWLCLAALRENSAWLELRPERWRWPDYWFGQPITGYHVAERAEAIKHQQAETVRHHSQPQD